MAKEAKATWKLRKTAMVDLVKFDKYLEEHCLENKKSKDESEDMDMPRARKPIENMDELIKSKKKNMSDMQKEQSYFQWDCTHFKI